MEKEKKHSKAEKLRSQFVLPGQRKAAIWELLKKNTFDQNDQLRLTVLFQKVAYLNGCEKLYRALICHVRAKSDKNMIAKTKRFSQKLSL